MSAGKRALARKNFIKHQAERINVTLRRQLFARNLFGRHVGGRAGAVPIAGFQITFQACDAKISNSRAPAAVNDDVGGFQIAMQNAGLVNRVKPGTKLSSDLKRFIGRQPADATK